jgi:hypothetical protein
MAVSPPMRLLLLCYLCSSRRVKQHFVPCLSCVRNEMPVASFSPPGKTHMLKCLVLG